MVKNPPAKQETWVQCLDKEDPLEKKMATHSSILAGKSHGQRSLVGYGPWGHKRVRYALASKQQQYNLRLKKQTLKFELCCIVATIGIETRN